MSILKLPSRIGGLIGSIPSTASGVYGLTKLREIEYPFAIGGDTYTYIQDGKYWRCHMFSQVGSDTLTFLRGGLVEYLVVGGGGGGGSGLGITGSGGGGAGGFRSASGFSVSSGSYTVTVGAGGASRSSGDASVFGSISAAGGGSGASFASPSSIAASSGGSGGGGALENSSGAAGNTPSASPAQGNSGGSENSTVRAAGGGGGSGGAGQDATTSPAKAGDGGVATSSSISGSVIYYAGGGGGGAAGGSPYNYAAGLGGGTSVSAEKGGGGDGAAPTSGSGSGGNGAANTGGGGGGQGYMASSPLITTAGGTGGSGIVIVRYQITQAEFEGDEPYYDNVSLLLHMNGSNGSTTFTDSSKHRHTVTANGNAQISTAQSKFGGASAAFDGTGDYLTSSFTSNLSIGDFTLELWAYMANFSSQFQAIYDGRVPGAATANCFIFYVNTSQKLVVDISGVAIYTSTATLPLSQWTHLAVARTGTGSNQATLYINGVADGSFTLSTNITGGGTVIGAFAFNPLGVYPFNGYIDDLRITKGVARYTGSFTPPQRQFRP